MVVGPNGAGKTNFLEGVHVGTQGSSLRTRRDARTVRFGCDHARVTTSGTTSPGRSFTAQVTISASGGTTVTLNGASAEGSTALRRQFPVLAFTPDRLAVVKGGPLVRRTYLDRALGRILPARADLPVDYAKVLAQRNAGLRRVRAGESSRVVLAPWTESVARLGTELDAATSRDGRFAGAPVHGPCRRARARGRRSLLWRRGRDGRRARGTNRPRRRARNDRGGPSSSRRRADRRRARPSLLRLPGGAANGRSGAPAWPRREAWPKRTSTRRYCCSTTCSASWTTGGSPPSWQGCRREGRPS